MCIVSNSLQFIVDVGAPLMTFKAKHLGNIQRYTPITLYTTLPFYNIIIIFDTVVTQKRNIEHEKQWFQQGCHICNFAWTVKDFPRRY